MDQQHVERDGRADRDHAAVELLDVAEAGHVEQVHHALGRDDHLLHQADEVGPAGDQFGLARPIAQVLEHLRLGRRRGVFEVFHGLWLPVAGSRLVSVSCDRLSIRRPGPGLVPAIAYRHVTPSSSAPPARAAASAAAGGTRTPRALATALLIAAPGEITGGSPRPITPRFRSLSGS